MMRASTCGTFIVAVLTVVAFSSGCGNSGDDKPVDVSPPGVAEDGNGHDHDAHGHAEEHEGPHGGHVMELGRNHEYHAELVENEKAGTVTVFILDKDLRELSIDQSAIVMNLTVDGQAKTFELDAVGANDGKASRFDASDRSLFEALHEHEATGKLGVTINGTPYTAEVGHHHHDDDHHESGEEHEN